VEGIDEGTTQSCFDKWFSSTVSREKGGEEKKARGKKKGKMQGN